MSFIKQPDFSPKLLFRSGNFNTIYTNLVRKVKDVNYQRVRIETPDDDFLDLDFSKSRQKTETIALLVHGLEGSSDTTYMKGMVKAVNNINYDAVALNLRGCSGELNRLYSSYHSGKSDDITTVINYILHHFEYKNIVLIGFSLGGNMLLKYAGEEGGKISIVKKVVAISAPCDLKATANQLSKSANYLYLRRFLISLKKKLHQKKQRFPEVNITTKAIENIKDFYDFDSLYTAPAHGFSSAEDYWEKCSAKNYISKIKISSLLINAIDDPFFSPACYPFEQAVGHQKFTLEIPEFGGHVGFMNSLFSKNILWSEKRVMAFLQEK